MKYFVLEAQDPTGKRLRERRTALSEKDLLREVRAEGLLVVRLTEDASMPSFVQAFNPFSWLPVSHASVELALRQLAAMLTSGVSLLTALQTVCEQASATRARHMWQRVRETILKGESLTEALTPYQRSLTSLVVNLVRVGEQSGELDRLLVRGADHLEAQREVRSRVVQALLYPLIALVLTLGVVIFLVTLVIPKIAAFLQTSGAHLPRMTQSLVDISTALTSHAHTIGFSFLFCVSVWILVRLFPKGRCLTDALRLRLPVSGKIHRLSATILLSRTLDTLLSSGVTLVEALHVSSHVMTNAHLAQCLNGIRAHVLDGATLEEAFARTQVFLPMLTKMIAVGEMTGNLAEAFRETARFHEKILARTISRLSTLLEPALIGIMGLLVGYVYVAFFTAVFSLASSGR